MTAQGDDFSHLGLKFIGQTSNGLWGKYIRTSDDGHYADERKRLAQKAREEREKAQKAQYESGLTIAERDKNIRLLHKHLGLTTAHRKELHRRGLTEDQIEKGLFFSVRGYTELPNFVDVRLPGMFVGKNGKKYLKGHSEGSIACVAFHGDKAVGIQLRHPQKENKYTWLKGLKSSHLNNGELPLTHLKPNNSKELWITEGILKPFITSAKFGLNVVGCSGFHIPSQQLRKIIQTENYQKIIFAVDANTPNNKHILRQLKKNIELVESLGVKDVVIGWWSQFTKKDKDIDELESLDEVKFISHSEFISLTNKQKFIQWKKEELKRLTEFTPDITFNKRFVAEELAQLDYLGKITAIKSPKNTGKSYFLPTLVRRIKSPILIIGNRRLLTRNLAEGLKSSGIPITYIDDEYSKDLVSSLIIGGENIAIVADSLKKITGLDLSEYFVIVDESEQVTETIGISKTHIDKVRGIVWGVLSQVMSECKGLLLMDADLSNRTCGYWSGLAPQLQLQRVENTFRIKKEGFIFPCGKSGYINILDHLYSFLAEGKKVTLVSDSETKLNQIHELFSKKYKTALITAPNIADNPSITRFFDDKGVLIAEENIQLTLISPVGQSGLSLELENYFDGVFGLFYGNVTTNIARQMLLRVRSNCPRYIWANNKGLNFFNRFDWKEIFKTDSELNDYLKDSVNYYKEVEKLSSLDAMKKVVELMESGANIQDVNNQNIAQCKAFINLDKSLYRDNLLDGLIQEGYTLSLVQENTFSDIAEELKAIGDGLKQKEALKVHKAPSIIDNEPRIEFLKRKPNLNESERAEFLRYQIEKALPQFDALTVPFILEYIIKDRFKTINGVQNYFLVNNPQIAKQLDFNSFSYALSQCHEGGVFYLSSKKYSLLVDVWQGLNLHSLLGETFTSESARDVLNGVTQRQRSILRSLGIKWHKESHAITTLSKIVQLFGFKTKKIKTVQGKRFYSVMPIELIKDEQNWLSIFNSINIKYSQEINDNNEIYTLIQSEYPQTIDNKAFSEGAVSTINNNKYPDTAPNQNQDIARDRDTLEESALNQLIKQSKSREKPEENNPNLGKLVNYLHPTKGILRGIIQKIDSIGYWVQDCVSMELIPCALNQIELLR
ncbi:hypothetical protein CSQ80_17580 [Cyanobacterium aponinum IPPAS B-1201]|nr:hypothetical protein CSQ80_17580 [Cyanobacterium aponinum IPPAS B-1201]